jgi:hypothetical protein
MGDKILGGEGVWGEEYEIELNKFSHQNCKG